MTSRAKEKCCFPEISEYRNDCAVRRKKFSVLGTGVELIVHRGPHTAALILTGPDQRNSQFCHFKEATCLTDLKRKKNKKKLNYFV